MNNQDFKYWISGYIALRDEKTLDNHQINIIKNHAALVTSMMGQLDDENVKLIDDLIGQS